MSNLSTRLSECRAALGITQSALAKQAGLKNQSIIGSLESGYRKASSHIPSIANALGVEPLWLAEGRGPKKRDLLPSSNTTAPEDEAKSTPPESSEQGKPADIHILKDRRKEDHQAIAEVLNLMLEMDDHGKWEVVVRAKDIAKERAVAAKANVAESSQ